MACILPQYANKFIDGLKSGEINPDKLTDMTSDDRRTFLSKYVGEENAKFVNTEFESKLLLKHQREGIINWAKKVGGLKEGTRKDIVDRVMKLEKAMNPAEQDRFLGDIVERRLGVKVTAEEAKYIFGLTKKMQENFDSRFDKPRSDFFKAKQELTKYIRDNSVVYQDPSLSDIISISRAVKVLGDLSASLRQGFAYFGTKEWGGAFRRMFEYAGSQQAMDNLEVDMMQHKYFEDAFKVKKQLGLTLFGASITQREESYASRFVDKIPILRGSARAYEGFLNDLRFNRFVNLVEKMENNGIKITEQPDAIEDLAKVISAASGRGELGVGERAATSLATVLFSPRWLASRIGLLVNPITKTGAARTEATLALARSAGLSVALLALFEAMGAEVEKDPRSADFGKVKIGNTRIDMTGGLAPYITFLVRAIRRSVKSSTTGKLTEINTGDFGSKSILDLATEFIENKTSPVARTFIDVALKGETFEGKKVGIGAPIEDTAAHIADTLFAPLLAKNAIEAFLQASGESNPILATVAVTAETFGLSTSTYDYKPSGKKWDDLRKDKGDKVYQQALTDINKQLKEQLGELGTTQEFREAPEFTDEEDVESKSDMIEDIRKTIVEDTYNNYS